MFHFKTNLIVHIYILNIKIYFKLILNIQKINKKYLVFLLVCYKMQQ